MTVDARIYFVADFCEIIFGKDVTGLLQFRCLLVF